MIRSFRWVNLKTGITSMTDRRATAPADSQPRKIGKHWDVDRFDSR